MLSAAHRRTGSGWGPSATGPASYMLCVYVDLALLLTQFWTSASFSESMAPARL